MSKYTTEVRYICESAAGLTESVGGLSVNDTIFKSLANVFNFPFPIFDEDYRSVLETKILKHYYTREIGLETVGLWKLKLDTRLNEIMPYYNQLYKSELLAFDPFHDVDYSHEQNKTTTGNATGTNTAHNVTDVTGHKTSEDNTTVSGTDSHSTTSHNTISNNDTDAYNDTPQGSLDNVKQLKYLSSYDEKNQTGTQDETGTTSGTTGNTTNGTITDDSTGKTTADLAGSTAGNYTNTDEYVEHITGKQGTVSYSEMLLKFRDTFLNIDMQIIDDLSDLFLNLW
jgi:hypothetical protein